MDKNKLIYNNQTYTDNSDIANAMNDHFCTIGKKRSQSLKTSIINILTVETQ